MYVCICQAVTERRIRQEIAAGARNLLDLKRTLGIGIRCGACEAQAEEVLEEELPPDNGEAPAAP